MPTLSLIKLKCLKQVNLRYQKKFEHVLALTGMLDLQSFFVISGDFLKVHIIFNIIGSRILVAALLHVDTEAKFSVILCTCV